jgi:hypothetical protein
MSRTIKIIILLYLVGIKIIYIYIYIYIYIFNVIDLFLVINLINYFSIILSQI